MKTQKPTMPDWLRQLPEIVTGNNSMGKKSPWKKTKQLRWSKRKVN
jgi:hypothetical protein